MADLQIALKYLPVKQRIAFWAMCALAPGWALLVPACLGAFISYVLITPSVADSSLCVMIVFLLLGLLVAGIAGTALVEDDTIYATKSGLSFPLAFLLNTNFRRHKEWAELTGAEVVSTDSNRQKLLLTFKKGSRIVLDRKYVSNADMEKLLLAVELLGSNCSRSANLIEFQHGLNVQKSVAGDSAYTQMWEEELGRRFSTTNFMPLEPDQQLRDGRIKIVRQLAFGGLSAIYLGQTSDSEMVVIKEAVVPASADEESKKSAQARLEKEFHTLSSLKHPNITCVRDYFVENNRNYLVLDYVNGQDLRQLVKQTGPKSDAQVMEWGITLCDVLQFLHTLQTPIIHRDFTPDNVVITNTGELIVIDFGAANEFLGAATGTLIGKQAYIAPEQLRGKAVPASDIYALGGSLFYLLTGRDPKPLAASHPKKVVPEVFEGLDALVAKCTAFEPVARYQSVTEVKEALTNCLHQQKIVIESKT